MIVCVKRGKCFPSSFTATLAGYQNLFTVTKIFIYSFLLYLSKLFAITAFWIWLVPSNNSWYREHLYKVSLLYTPWYSHITMNLYSLVSAAISLLQQYPLEQAIPAWGRILVMSVARDMLAVLQLNINLHLAITPNSRPGNLRFCSQTAFDSFAYFTASSRRPWRLLLPT